MDKLTRESIKYFIKPNFYLLQNVVTFLLPSRKNQFEFIGNKIREVTKRLSDSPEVDKVHRLVELEFLQIERIFMTYLLSEEMGTYFEAMTNHQKGDIIKTVLCKESYQYAQHFYDLKKKRKRDFFSRLMIYPFTPELRAAFSLSEDQEFILLINKIINISCNYLWNQKETIRCFREKYKGVFNSYKHCMSILYNIKSEVNINLTTGAKLTGIWNSPLVLNVRFDRKRMSEHEKWSHLHSFQSIEDDTNKMFNMIYNLFYVIVKKRVDFILNILEAYKYNSLSKNFTPYKRFKFSMRTFGTSEVPEDVIKSLHDKYGITVELKDK